MTSPVPTEIAQAGARELRIRWADGHESLYPVAYLRRACSCAACVDEWTGVRTLDPAAVPGDVKPVRVSPVGRYAIGIEWSDGHRSGIYGFDYLRRICPCRECQRQGGAREREREGKTEEEDENTEGATR
jgi:DUF971 family protein